MKYSVAGLLGIVLLTAATARATTYTLGTTALLEGPTGGSDSVVLVVVPSSGTWTATTNATWLHLSLANQNGAGGTNVIFGFDTNSGATRVGTLTIAGQTVTVTQAGATYVPAFGESSLPIPDAGALTLDNAGNVYVTDLVSDSIDEWSPGDTSSFPLVTLDLINPASVAVDGSGNVYILDTGDFKVKEWSVMTGDVTTLFTLINNGGPPAGIAVDSAGNVFVSDTYFNAIRKWSPATSNLTTLDTPGLYNPGGIAVDVAGNVYFADTVHYNVKEWMAANSNVITLVPSGLIRPGALAADGSGNLYIADGHDGVVKEWMAATSNLITAVSFEVGQPAVDSSGNIYLTAQYGIEDVPHAFVDPTPKLEGLAAGSDTLPVALPATVDLTNIFMPEVQPVFGPPGEQPWLSISGVTNDVVSFSFTADTGPARTTWIYVLGQAIPITQGVIGGPAALTGAQMFGYGQFRFTFTNVPSAVYTVLFTTNLLLPLNEWTVLGAAGEGPPGQYEFGDEPSASTQHFYAIRSP